MPKQDLEPLLNSDEVIIVLRAVNNSQVDFTIRTSATPLEESEAENRVNALINLAAGMVAECKENPAKLFMKGTIVVGNVEAKGV